MEKRNLVIIACHLKSELQIEILKNNLPYFEKSNLDIMIVYSEDNAVPIIDLETISKNIIKVDKINNNKYLDFGKWMYGIHSINYAQYKNVLFTNDSYILTGNIDNYLDTMATHDYQLYGFTDSTEITYHYQSYLFFIHTSQIDRFRELYVTHYNKIETYMDVVLNYELKMESKFFHKNCHLSIANLPNNQGKNVFCMNNELYEQLFCDGSLPIIKVRYLSTVTEAIREKIPSRFVDMKIQ